MSETVARLCHTSSGWPHHTPPSWTRPGTTPATRDRDARTWVTGLGPAATQRHQQRPGPRPLLLRSGTACWRADAARHAITGADVHFEGASGCTFLAKLRTVHSTSTAVHKCLQVGARSSCALCSSRDYVMSHSSSACIRTLRQSTAVHNKYGFSATVCWVNEDPAHVCAFFWAPQAPGVMCTSSWATVNLFHRIRVDFRFLFVAGASWHSRVLSTSKPSTIRKRGSLLRSLVYHRATTTLTPIQVGAAEAASAVARELARWGAWSPTSVQGYSSTSADGHGHATAQLQSIVGTPCATYSIPCR